MTEQGVKVNVGLVITISHFALIAFIFVLYTMKGFTFEEVTTTIALIVPMFGIYTSAVIKYLIDNKASTEDKSSTVTKSFIFMSFFLPLVFIGMLAMIITMKAYNIAFSSFEEFKLMLGALQTALGIYMGILLSSLFDIKEKGKTQQRK